MIDLSIVRQIFNFENFTFNLFPIVAKEPKLIDNNKKNAKEFLKKVDEEQINQLKSQENKSSEEFDKLIEKAKIKTYRIMANFSLNKKEPFYFEKNKKDEELANLSFDIGEANCFIQYVISKQDKKEFQKLSFYQIIEDFITRHLLY
jgi:hypothetical protein